jgi:hypothetical protein
MAVVPRPFPAVLPHGSIREVLPGFHFVTGSVRMPGPVPVRFGRAMTIVREGDRTILVNTVRLNDDGLRALDALGGRVTDIIRIAGNHGMDDPFYADRYKAKVWVVKGQRYTAGFDTQATDTYFAQDVEMDGSSRLPIEGARLLVLGSNPPEGLLLVDRHGGVAIAGDCLQNWTEDEQANLLGRFALRMGGFRKPHNVGPAWLNQAKPPKADLRAILDLGFANVLPSHGVPVLGDATEKYRPAIDRVTAAS